MKQRVLSRYKKYILRDVEADITVRLQQLVDEFNQDQEILEITQDLDGLLDKLQSIRMNAIWRDE